MSIINLVFKALEGAEQILLRSANRRDAVVDANRTKQSHLLVAHSDRVAALENKIAEEESKYALASMDLSFINVDQRKRAERERKLAGVITNLIKSENAQ